MAQPHARAAKTTLHQFPIRFFPIPGQMTRNLLESDWDELSLLVATSSLKRSLQRRASNHGK